MTVVLTTEAPDTICAPTDDIADPPVPMPLIADAAAHAAVTVDPQTPLGQATMSLDEALYKFSQHAATCLKGIDTSWDAALRVLHHNNGAIEALTAALQAWAPHTPYRATVHVLSPAGFTMTLTVEALTQEAFLERVGALMAFLRENGFQPTAAMPL